MGYWNWGVPPAEFQAVLMETALRVLAGAGLATIAAASVTYFLLWVAELRRPRRRRTPR